MGEGIMGLFNAMTALLLLVGGADATREWRAPTEDNETRDAAYHNDGSCPADSRLASNGSRSVQMS